MVIQGIIYVLLGLVVAFVGIGSVLFTEDLIKSGLVVLSGGGLVLLGLSVIKFNMNKKP